MLSAVHRIRAIIVVRLSRSPSGPPACESVRPSASRAGNRYVRTVLSGAQGPARVVRKSRGRVRTKPESNSCLKSNCDDTTRSRNRYHRRVPCVPNPHMDLLRVRRDPRTKTVEVRHDVLVRLKTRTCTSCRQVLVNLASRAVFAFEQTFGRRVHVRTRYRTGITAGF